MATIKTSTQPKQEITYLIEYWHYDGMSHTEYDCVKETLKEANKYIRKLFKNKDYSSISLYKRIKIKLPKE